MSLFERYIKSKGIVFLQCMKHFSYTHYYGTLKDWNGAYVPVEHVLTTHQAANLNRWSGGRTYKPGYTSSKFETYEDLISHVVSTWKEHFPDGRVLIEGFTSAGGPQRVILAEGRGKELNALFDRCEELGWWDEGNDDEVRAISRRWFEIILEIVE